MRRSSPTQRMVNEIARIHSDDLAYGPAYDALVAIALAGCEMNVYQHSQGEWVIWLRPAERWQDGRYTLAEWTRDYAQLAAEALARQAVKGDAA